MDPFSAAGGALGGALGFFAGSGDRQAAMDHLKDATDTYKNLNTDVAAQQATGNYAANAAQLDAINRLKQVYQNGGQDAQSRADQYAAQQSANQQTQAQQNAVRQQMAQRGLASSGANFAAQRQAAQNESNQAAAEGMQAQAAGEQRAMGALQGAGTLANAYGGQSNALSQFNASQRQGAEQDTARNSLDKAGGIASGDQAQADAYNKQAQQMQQMGSGMGQGIGSLAGFMSDERIKTKIRDIAEKTVTGVPLKAFEYKHAPGQRYMGVMAQDLEKVHPEHVATGPDGLKRVSPAFAPVPIGKAA